LPLRSWRARRRVRAKRWQVVAMSVWALMSSRCGSPMRCPPIAVKCGVSCRFQRNGPRGQREATGARRGPERSISAGAVDSGALTRLPYSFMGQFWRNGPARRAPSSCVRVERRVEVDKIDRPVHDMATGTVEVVAVVEDVRRVGHSAAGYPPLRLLYAASATARSEASRQASFAKTVRSTCRRTRSKRLTRRGAIAHSFLSLPNSRSTAPRER
jgi:hypothetical protein